MCPEWAGAPITFLPYPSERVTISGADVISASAWSVFERQHVQSRHELGPGSRRQPDFSRRSDDDRSSLPNTTLDVSHPVSAQIGNGSYVDGGTGVSTATMHNEVYDYGIQTVDLGCIYEYGSEGNGTKIAYNLCHHDGGTRLGAGIYLDFNSTGYVAHHNVIWDAQNSARMNSVSRNNRIYNNTFAARSSDTGFAITPGHDGDRSVSGLGDQEQHLGLHSAPC